MTDPAVAPVTAPTIAPEAPPGPAPEGPDARQLLDAAGGTIAAGAPPPDAPPEETDRLARAQAVADKLKAKSAARRAKLAQANGAITRAQQLEAQVAQERLGREAAEAQARAWEAAPIQEMQRRGITAKAISEAAVEQNSPEALARKALDDNAALRRELAQRDHVAARSAFLTEAKTFDDLEYAAAHAATRPQAFLAEAESVLLEKGAAFRAQYGRGPTNREVIEFLNYQYELADKARSTKPGKGSEKTTATPETPKNGTANPAATLLGAGAKTLTSRTAERATLPTSFDDLDPDAQLAVMAKQLRERSTARS